jgi:hypothetical protein
MDDFTAFVSGEMSVLVLGNRYQVLYLGVTLKEMLQEHFVGLKRTPCFTLRLHLAHSSCQTNIPLLY